MCATRKVAIMNIGALFVRERNILTCDGGNSLCTVFLVMLKVLFVDAQW